MRRKNWYWDLNLNEEKVKKILSQDSDPRFVMVAAALLSRVVDPKQVFDLISPASFCRRWYSIEKEVRGDKWSKEKAAFWKATYLRLSRELRQKGERFRKVRILEVDEFDSLLIKKVRQCRKSALMSQKELAKFMGCNQQFVSGIETGREKVTLEFLKKLSKITGQEIVICIKPERK